MRNFRSDVLILQATLGFVFCGVLSAADLGYVRVTVSDTDGIVIADPTVTVLDSHGKTVPSALSPLPYGVYTVRAECEYFDTEERRVELYEPEVHVLMALPFRHYGDGTFTGYELTGRVDGLPSGKKAFIRVVSALGSFAKETLILPSGEFDVKGLPVGIFVVLLVSESALKLPGVTGTQETVTVEGTASISLMRNSPRLRYRFPNSK